MPPLGMISVLPRDIRDLKRAKLLTLGIYFMSVAVISKTSILLLI